MRLPCGLSQPTEGEGCSGGGRNGAPQANQHHGPGLAQWLRTEIWHLGLSFEQVLRAWPGIFVVHVDGGVGAKSFATTVNRKGKELDLQMFTAHEDS